MASGSLDALTLGENVIIGGLVVQILFFGKVKDRYTIGETFANISAVCLTPLLQKNPVRTSSIDKLLSRP